MATPNLAQARKNLADDASRCLAPCVRCIKRTAVAVSLASIPRCSFCPDTLYLQEFKAEGKQYNRCRGCLDKSEGCYKVDSVFFAQAQALGQLLRTLDNGEDSLVGPPSLAEVKEKAGKLAMFLDGKERVPNHAFYHLHDGLDEDSQTGLLDGSGRSRAKDLVAVKEARRKRDLQRAMEGSDEEGLDAITPHKRQKTKVTAAAPSSSALAAAALQQDEVEEVERKFYERLKAGGLLLGGKSCKVSWAQAKRA